MPDLDGAADVLNELLQGDRFITEGPARLEVSETRELFGEPSFGRTRDGP